MEPSTSTHIKIEQMETLGVSRRLLEILPAALSWSLLIAPVILSLFAPVVVAYFIIAFDLYWLIKSFRMSTYLVRGYSRLWRYQKYDWNGRLAQLADLGAALRQAEDHLKAAHKKHGLAGLFKRRSKQEQFWEEEVGRLQGLADRKDQILDYKKLINVVIIATYNESKAILEPSVKALTETEFPLEQMMLVIAYEERGGEDIARTAKELVQEYGPKFRDAIAIMHPDGLPGEVRGKGANISYACREAAKKLREQNVDPKNVIVTTLDADNRPSKNYFAYLTYTYATTPEPVRKSYQPIPMFYNNIWYAPAPIRVIATGNSFWVIMEAMRPHRLRNFAAHSQSLQALLDTDFWSKTSIVEDGHQYWRTYFTYHGDHEVVPLFTPVYQDAVLASTYLKTFKVQYLQLRRWAWGVSDFPYVVINCIRDKQISFWEKVVQVWRLMEGHLSWATAPLIMTFVAWLPLYLNRSFGEKLLAHQLPIIASRLLTLAMIGIAATLAISLLSLPPKPSRYRRTRFLGMIAQWALLPIVAIFFSAFAALDAQSRLMLGKYMGFRVTEKKAAGADES